MPSVPGASYSPLAAARATASALARLPIPLPPFDALVDRIYRLRLAALAASPGSPEWDVYCARLIEAAGLHVLLGRAFVDPPTPALADLLDGAARVLRQESCSDAFARQFENAAGVVRSRLPIPRTIRPRLRGATRAPTLATAELLSEARRAIAQGRSTIARVLYAQYRERIDREGVTPEAL